jgi:predicted Zn-ribbon and HTH transcriptional regulator
MDSLKEVCPRCKSENISTVRNTYTADDGTLMLLDSLTAQCHTCGFEYLILEIDDV